MNDQISQTQSSNIIFTVAIERLADGTTKFWYNGDIISTMTVSDAQISQGTKLLIMCSDGGTLVVGDGSFTPLLVTDNLSTKSELTYLILV